MLEALSTEKVAAALLDAAIRKRKVSEFLTKHEMSKENFNSYLGKLMKELGIDGVSDASRTALREMKTNESDRVDAAIEKVTVKVGTKGEKANNDRRKNRPDLKKDATAALAKSASAANHGPVIPGVADEEDRLIIPDNAAEMCVVVSFNNQRTIIVYDGGFLLAMLKPAVVRYLLLLFLFFLYFSHSTYLLFKNQLLSLYYLVLLCVPVHHQATIEETKEELNIRNKQRRSYPKLKNDRLRAGDYQAQELALDEEREEKERVAVEKKRTATEQKLLRKQAALQLVQKLIDVVQSGQSWEKLNMSTLVAVAELFLGEGESKSKTLASKPMTTTFLNETINKFIDLPAFLAELIKRLAHAAGESENSDDKNSESSSSSGSSSSSSGSSSSSSGSSSSRSSSSGSSSSSSDSSSNKGSSSGKMVEGSEGMIGFAGGDEQSDVRASGDSGGYLTSVDTADCSSVSESQTFLHQAKLLQNEAEDELSGGEIENNNNREQRNKYLRTLRAIKLMTDERDYRTALDFLEKHVELDKLQFSWVPPHLVCQPTEKPNKKELDQVMEALGFFVTFYRCIEPEREQYLLQYQFTHSKKRNRYSLLFSVLSNLILSHSPPPTPYSLLRSPLTTHMNITVRRLHVEIVLTKKRKNKN